MSTASIAALNFRVNELEPTLRLVGEAVSWLGGGLLFAATLYVLVAWPGLVG